jgi:hypothetical protein
VVAVSLGNVVLHKDVNDLKIATGQETIARSIVHLLKMETV